MFPPLVHLLRVLVRRHPHVPQVPPVPTNFAHRPAHWVRKGQEELAGHLPLHLLVCPCGKTPLFSVLHDLDGREVRNPEKKCFGFAPLPHPRNIAECSSRFLVFFLASQKELMVT